MEVEKADYPITVMCRVLEVSRSGYYAWRSRRPGVRAQEEGFLLERIRRSHKESYQTYGSPRITMDLRAEGIQAGKNRVARLMRENGIRARRRRRFRPASQVCVGRLASPHLLERDFSATGPNQKWGSDITYIRTGQGWLYLAVILDLFSRLVVGWSFSRWINEQLILDALHLALGRRPIAPGLIVHSDQGLQYTASEYRRILQAHQAVCSMSRKGNCWDNAVVESFFASLKKELVYPIPFSTRHQAQVEIFQYIECFYNRKRRHSTLDYLSPYDYEQKFRSA